VASKSGLAGLVGGYRIELDAVPAATGGEVGAEFGEVFKVGVSKGCGVGFQILVLGLEGFKAGPTLEGEFEFVFVEDLKNEDFMVLQPHLRERFNESLWFLQAV